MGSRPKIKEATDARLLPYRQIGKGHCGSVWAYDQEGPSVAMKREDGGPGRSVWKDSQMHRVIESSLKRTQDELGLAMRVNIPKHYGLVGASNRRWWKQRRDPYMMLQSCLLLARRARLRSAAEADLSTVAVVGVMAPSTLFLLPTDARRASLWKDVRRWRNERSLSRPPSFDARRLRCGVLMAAECVARWPRDGKRGGGAAGRVDCEELCR